jgi:hypothetical protein
MVNPILWGIGAGLVAIGLIRKTKKGSSKDEQENDGSSSVRSERGISGQQGQSNQPDHRQRLNKGRNRALKKLNRKIKEERDARLRLEGSIAAHRGITGDNNGSQQNTSQEHSQVLSTEEDQDAQ